MAPIPDYEATYAIDGKMHLQFAEANLLTHSEGCTRAKCKTTSCKHFDGTRCGISICYVPLFLALCNVCDTSDQRVLNSTRRAQTEQ